MADLALPALDVTALTPTPPSITNLTSEALDGTGAFDVLMKTVKLHLEEEYNASRITGKDYANVYLGAITAVMQQAVAYLVSSNQVFQINAEIGLIRQQIVTELAQTDDSIPDGLGFNASTSVLGMLKLQKDKTSAEISQAEAATLNQTHQVDSQILVNTATIDKMDTDAEDQRTKVTHEVALMDQQKAKLISDADDQHTKVTHEVTLIDHQGDKVVQDIVDQTRTVDKDLLVKAAQIGKMEGEVLLLGQKTVSELANTCDTLPTKAVDPGNTQPWLNTTSSIQGNLGKQNTLYAAQTDGFARDAEQKLAKIMVDTWSVRMASDGADASAVNHLEDSSIGQVIAKAKTGINI